MNGTVNNGGHSNSPSSADMHGDADGSVGTAVIPNASSLNELTSPALLDTNGRPTGSPPNDSNLPVGAADERKSLYDLLFVMREDSQRLEVRMSDIQDSLESLKRTVEEGREAAPRRMPNGPENEPGSVRPRSTVLRAKGIEEMKGLPDALALVCCQDYPLEVMKQLMQWTCHC